jgi:signal transduction histidine kinase
MVTTNSIIGADSGLVRPAARGAKLHRHFSTLAAAGAWSYAIAIPIVSGYSRLQPGQFDAVAPWIALPLQVLAMVSVGWLLIDRSLAHGAMRRFWWLILGFTSLNTLANWLWNIPRTVTAHEQLDVFDALYLIDYCLLTAAFATLFLRAGGTFTSMRIWLDIATMVIVQLAALWGFFLAPGLPRTLGHDISIGATLSYSLVVTVMTSLAALVCIRTPRFPGRALIYLFAVAALAEAAWEVIWLGSWLVDFEFIGAFYNYGDVLCFACICTAASIAHRGTPPAAAPGCGDLRGDGFLPALAVLAAIAMIGGTLATTKRVENWLLVGLASLCALLLITRQSKMRGEVQALTKQLATREADARLTELVRRSTDLIVVIDRAGLVGFASPAARSILRVPDGDLHGLPAARLFGSANEALMRSFLDGVLNGDPADDIEVHFERPPGTKRVYKVAAANQLGNPLINGIVLTAHEMTGQRELEREVLEAATRERVRLSGAIHDGLGQELTGIALMLHATAKMPAPDPQEHRGQLRDIVERVNQTIVTARNLAGGLSPVRVARGSLCRALHGLSRTAGRGMPVRVHVDPQFKDELIDDFCADHLYRIAEEAVDNASQHSGGTRVDIQLGATPDHIELSVTDDGGGLHGRASAKDSWGLRLMEYRVRILAGTLGILPGAESGTRIEVRIPLTAARPPRAAA